MDALESGCAVAKGPKPLVWQLDQIGRRLGDVSDLEGLAAALRDITEQLIEVQYSAFYFRDPRTGRLRLLVAKGFTEEERRLAEDTAEERHPGLVMRTGKVLHVPDTEKDRRHLTKDSPRSFTVRSRLYIPVIVSGKVIGTLGLGSPRPRAFTRRTIHVLSFAAALAGVAYARIVAAEGAQQVESVFKAVLETSPSPFMVLDCQGRVRFWNRAAQLHLGLSPGEVMGQQVLEGISASLCGPITDLVQGTGAHDPGRPVIRDALVHLFDGREGLFHAHMWRLVLSGEPQVAVMLVPSEVPGPDAADQYRLLLEREVQLRGHIIEKKTREHREAADRLRGTVREMVRVLGSVVDVRDPYTAGHQRRTADLARTIATAMGFAPDVVEGLRIAGTVHDIGKIAIPAEILVRPGRLSEVEYQLVQTHVQIGYSILRDIEFGRPVAEIVY